MLPSRSLPKPPISCSSKCRIPSFTSPSTFLASRTFCLTPNIHILRLITELKKPSNLWGRAIESELM